MIDLNRIPQPEDLAFIRRRSEHPNKGALDCWAADPDQYREVSFPKAKGAMMALDLLEHFASYPRDQLFYPYALLGDIVRDMIRAHGGSVDRGRGDPIINGFMELLAELATAAFQVHGRDKVEAVIVRTDRCLREYEAAQAAKRSQRARHAARARWNCKS